MKKRKILCNFAIGINNWHQMTQDDRWKKMWKKYMDYLHKHQKRPSKYNPRDMKLVNWLKHNRKLMNKGAMQEQRKAKFNELLAEAAKYQRVNQHTYINNVENKDDE